MRTAAGDTGRAGWFERPPLWIRGTAAILSFALAVISMNRMEDFLRPEAGSALKDPVISGGMRVPSTLRAGAFLSGFRVAAAHLFWLQTLQYYGDSLNAREHYQKLLDYCWVTADLNPHFVRNYEFGATVLAFQEYRVEEAFSLLKKGIASNPEEVRLKLLLAAIGYLNTDQYGNILPFLEDLVRSGNAPPRMVNILANAYGKAGRMDDAIRVWQWILRHSASDESRDEAARALEKLYQSQRDARPGVVKGKS